MTNIIENKNFEEKMKDRIKESIGDLITDEELKKLLDAAMYDVFFKPSKVKVNSWETTDGPSYLQAIVKELLDKTVRSVIKDYIVNHTEEVEKTIKTVVENGIGAAMMSAFSSMFSTQFYQFQSNVQAALQNKGIY